MFSIMHNILQHNTIPIMIGRGGSGQCGYKTLFLIVTFLEVCVIREKSANPYSHQMWYGETSAGHLSGQLD